MNILESPLLKSGITLACFHSLGKTPVVILVLQIALICGAMISAEIFSNFADSPSSPVAFDGDKLEICILNQCKKKSSILSRIKPKLSENLGFYQKLLVIFTILIQASPRQIQTTLLFVITKH